MAPILRNGKLVCCHRMKSRPKAADRMHIASKSWETHFQHASNGHSGLRMFQCGADQGHEHGYSSSLPKCRIYVLEE